MSENGARHRSSLGLRVVSSRLCFVPIEEVVGGADHRPLGFDLFEATQEESAEASGLFDVPGDRNGCSYGGSSQA